MVVGGALRRLLGGGADGGVVGCAPGHPAWLESVHRDDRGPVAGRIADLLEGRSESLEMQVRWSTPGGEDRWMRLRGRVIRRDARGRALRLAGSLSDETDPHRLRAAALHVEEGAALREAALRSLPGAAVGIFDESRRISLVEGDASSPDGEGQTLTSRLLLQGFPPATQSRLDAAFTRALAGQASRLEVRHAGRRLEIRTGPLRGASGASSRGVVLVLDLSRRQGKKGQVPPP
jgi:hypothetical protein